MSKINTGKYYVRDGIDEKHMSDDYQVLRGPGGFRCVITEPGDRTFDRDLSPIVDEINRLQSEIDRLEKELKECREKNKSLQRIVNEYCGGGVCEQD